MRGMAHPPTNDTDNERVGIYLLRDRVQELSLEMGVKVHGSCGNYAERIYKVYITLSALCSKQHDFGGKMAL
jgi:hypothetical protein